MAFELVKLLDAGVAAEDRKDQGVAFLELVYPGGRTETVELTKMGVARSGNKVLQVNEEQMKTLLQQMLKECADKGVIGESKSHIIASLGQPDAEEYYDTPILDPAKHSQAERDQWLASTPYYGLLYGDIVLQFNVHDKVVAVKPKP